jgi:HPt (histidine-containing phosphotransfer) domain-containing protein
MPAAPRPEPTSLPLFDGTPPTPDESRANALACFESDTSLFDRIAPLFRRAALEQAQSLHEALAAGDPTRVRHWAHTLKGSLLTVGARMTARHASEIERIAREAGLDGLEPAVMQVIGETRVIADHLSPPA